MSMSVIIARGVLSEVRRQGHDPYALLARVQIDRRRLLDSSETLSLNEVELLFREAVAVTLDPSLGLSIGEHGPITMWQTLSQVLLAQRTLRDAFSALSRYSALLIDDTLWTLSESEHRAHLLCKLQIEKDDVGRSLIELLFAMLVRIAQRFSARHALPVEVHFRHSAPSYAERYQQVFGCPVKFSRDVDALSFSLACVDAPQPHPDELLRTIGGRAAEQILAQRVQARATSQTVIALLRSERCLENIDIGKIARHARLDLNALRRRLRREGTTLSDLIDAARSRIACEDLLATTKPMRALAEQLGFSETSAFHRAFRRWTGTTPGAYRRGPRYAPLSEVQPPKLLS
jgi:AraC-like DNA-binding protein